MYAIVGEDTILTRWGRFLYAKLLLESLKGQVTVRGIKSTLSTVPQELYDFYDTIFERVEGQNKSSRQLALDALTWLTYAQRPMTALELQHALAVEPGEGSLDVENLVDLEELISICKGLVAVSTESNIISFIHITVAEYFRDQRRTWMASGQVAIASTCLTYLCFDCFADGPCANDKALQQRLEKYPFLDYASHFWGIHFQAVHPGSLDDRALNLLTHDGKVSSCSQIMLLPDRHTPLSSEMLPKNVSGLHLVVFFDIEWLARLLLDQGFDICARDSWGRDPLAWAVEYNHLSMTRLLLKSGADTGIRDTKGRTHFALAAMNGYEDIANHLFICGADPSTRDFAGQTAFSLAATHGHLLMVRFLFSLGVPDVEVDSQDDYGRTALFCAADQGHDDVVAWLVAHASININARDNMGATPLITSARRGQIGVVKILLEQTSIITNMEDHSGRTALMWAVIEGQLEVLQLLLSREDATGALNSTDYSGRSPRDWAIIGDQVSILNLLSYRAESEDKVKE